MSIAAFIAASITSLWIDYAAVPLDSGGYEYIIRVPPELIDTLRTEGIDSYVPPGTRDIRRIRIVVGAEPLPKAGGDAPRLSGEGQVTAARPNLDKSASSAASGEDSPRNRDAREQIVRYPSNEKTADGGRESTSALVPDASGGVLLGLEPLVLAELGLGIMAALILFLAWAHWGLRARYRSILREREAV